MSISQISGTERASIKSHKTDYLCCDHPRAIQKEGSELNVANMSFFWVHYNNSSAL